MKKLSILLLTGVLLSACVSKKKYVALEQENGEIRSELQKTQVAKEDLEAKFDEIQARIDTYNSKINSLTEENDAKIVTVGDDLVISNDVRKQMEATLQHVDPNELAQAQTLKDSMNLAVGYISDKMLFNSGSYRISSKADAILQKIADVINSEESLDVMVEGHTDNKTMVANASVKDNWDLSVLRATSVVKKLQKDYGVAPEKLIAAGRSFYQPLVDNDTSENRAKNRRTRIIILPNINKFFALMASNE